MARGDGGIGSGGQDRGTMARKKTTWKNMEIGARCNREKKRDSGSEPAPNTVTATQHSGSHLV